MEIVSAAEMRAIENEAIKRQGITLKELMSLAGKAVADVAAGLVDDHGEIVIFCGKGNNGGDGFIAARLLAAQGHKVKVIAMRDTQPEGAAGEALEALTGSPVEIENLSPELCLKPDLVIDALLGFGLKGEVRGEAKEAIERVNTLGSRVLAVDIPSGVDSDTGQVANVAVRADHTVTFTCPKIGLALYPGAELAGKVHYADIGIWPDIVDQFATVRLTSTDMVSQLLPRRPRETNKHRCGSVLVVAGSVGMTGAAAMTSQAALRTGAGIVTLALPRSLNDIMEVKLTEVMTVPLPETTERGISASAVEPVLELADRFDVLALGPGLSQTSETAKFTRNLLMELKLPVVVDADGLNNLVGTDILEKRQTPTVITPHTGELSRLIGRPARDIEMDRIAIAGEVSRRFKATLVLKGSRTVISGHGATMINPTGNPGMATAGTGDVLTGIIAALMAQGLPDFPAAVAGVYLHGLAGDLAAGKQGELALIATDLIDWVPMAIKEVKRDE